MNIKHKYAERIYGYSICAYNSADNYVVKIVVYLYITIVCINIKNV